MIVFIYMKQYIISIKENIVILGFKVLIPWFMYFEGFFCEIISIPTILYLTLT